MKAIIKKDIIDKCNKFDINVSIIEDEVVYTLFHLLKRKEEIMKVDGYSQQDINKMWREFRILLDKYGYDFKREE